jgi:hypothetical protein
MSTPKKCQIYTSSWNSFGITNFWRIITCNERRINRVHLKLSLYIYTNCQNRPFGKEFITTAFVNLHIYYVDVNIILWRNLNISSTTLFPEWLTSLSTSIKFKYCIIKRISHYSIDAPGQRREVNVAYWAQAVMPVPRKTLKKSSVRDSRNLK